MPGGQAVSAPRHLEADPPSTGISKTKKALTEALARTQPKPHLKSRNTRSRPPARRPGKTGVWDGGEAEIHREICHLLLGLSKRTAVSWVGAAASPPEAGHSRALGDNSGSATSASHLPASLTFPELPSHRFARFLLQRLRGM